ncbi:signal recognition particle 19 kDa protein-like [Stylophora pistillata]|uniref:signal recognition particle 19 kDa protein-like n=1 Tax=Stylophora pistillata TaxID=50429 RepID=UPI000C04570C|nr:signal recognition particle 19 kDa protein-like [Stylophora pistillata]
MAHLSTDPASKDRWIVVYPAYLNSRRTVQQGRRVPKEKAADNPTVYEIRDVCQSQGLNCEVESKFYPKDSAKDALCKGRVRVQLKNSDESFVNEKFQSRKALFLFLGEMIPKLKSRQSKSSQSDNTNQQQGAGATAKKKKGKKGKGK